MEKEWKKCEKCLVNYKYKGEHTCSPWIAKLVKMHKDKNERINELIDNQKLTSRQIFLTPPKEGIKE